jgi:hypothetical protein
LLSLVLSLALTACTTRTLATGVAVVNDSARGITGHGFVDGELLLRFTPEGERAIAPVAGTPAQQSLRLGIPSLDRLNVKYRASALIPLAGERGTYRLVLARDANVMRAAEEYGREPLVASAEPNYLLRIERPAEEPGTVRTDVSR